MCFPSWLRSIYYLWWNRQTCPAKVLFSVGMAQLVWWLFTWCHAVSARFRKACQPAWHGTALHHRCLYLQNNQCRADTLYFSSVNGVRSLPHAVSWRHMPISFLCVVFLRKSGEDAESAVPHAEQDLPLPLATFLPGQSDHGQVIQREEHGTNVTMVG